jgi:hypothetical protein
MAPRTQLTAGPVAFEIGGRPARRRRHGRRRQGTGGAQHSAHLTWKCTTRRPRLNSSSRPYSATQPFTGLQTLRWSKPDSNCWSHGRSVPGSAGWCPNPCSGGFELLVPGTASSVAAPCHSIRDVVSGVGQAPRLTALSPARRATHSGAAGRHRGQPPAARHQQVEQN